MVKPTSKIMADAAIKRIEALDDQACEIRSKYYCARFGERDLPKTLCRLAAIQLQQAQTYEAAALFIAAPLACHSKQLGRVKAAHRVMTRQMASHIVVVMKF